jgi:hypothetical protein
MGNIMLISIPIWVVKVLNSDVCVNLFVQVNFYVKEIPLSM